MSIKAAAKHKQLNKLRRQIAIESARLMSEEGIDNFQYARKKAAQRFGINNTHAYPDNKEILAQIKIHQSLYQKSTHEQLIWELRSTALNAMKLLHVFNPRLTGSVLLGHASEHSGIDIQLMADSPEEIAVLLMEHDIPYQLIDWKLHFSKHKNSHQIVPTFQFYAGDHLVNLIVLSEKQRKMVPIGPENRQTMQRASLKQVEALLGES